MSPPKYPQPGATYESCLYPGHQCRVLSVLNAQVTFKWLAPYKYIDEQVVPVNQFIVDFTLCGESGQALAD